MEPIPISSNPLRQHALGCIQISGYMLAGASILFLGLIPFTPHSTAYCLTAAATGAATFPILWRHWRRPNNLLFTAIIVLLVISRSSAEKLCFPELHGISWLLLLQFLSLYVLAEFSLVYFFRHRLIESIDIQPPPMS